MSEFTSSLENSPYDPSMDEYGWQDASSEQFDEDFYDVLDGPIEPAPKFVGYARLPQLPDENVVVLDNGVMYTDGENGDVFYIN